MWKVRFSQLQVVVIILKCCIATLRYLLFYSCEKQKAKLWIHFETLLDSNQFHVNSTQKPIGHSHKHCICISSRFFFYFYFYFDLKKKSRDIYSTYKFHLRRTWDWNILRFVMVWKYVYFWRRNRQMNENQIYLQFICTETWVLFNDKLMSIEIFDVFNVMVNIIVKTW